jgi:hypothetical protein
MDVGAAFIANHEAAELIEPGKTSFDDPAMAPKFGSALDIAACDARADAAPAQRAPVDRIVVALVGVDFARALARSSAWTTDCRDAVDERDQPCAVVDVGGREVNDERDALSIHGKMPLRAGLAAIGRVRASVVAPFLAGTLALSTAARSQSIASAAPRRSSIAWWMRAHTPACCHACSLRQQVMPQQRATSYGRYSHGMPVCRTNRMPRNASRGGTGGRPPFGRGRAGGMSGSINAHKSSGRSCRAMPAATPHMVNNSLFC